MKIRILSNNTEKELTTKQLNLFHIIDDDFAVTYHNIYWCNKNDKVCTTDMRSGKRQSSHQTVMSYIKVNGAWQQLRIFSVNHDITLAETVTEFKGEYEDHIPFWITRKAEVEQL